MDWVSRALRRIITFTQNGGEINVIVAGINVGAQPYWNAEATMLMHTKGILVMTPDSAMVLTGKQSLDYSGGVSAEDNFGIGGYDRVMGPNGQAQYWAPNLQAACDILFAHYDHAYLAPRGTLPAPRRDFRPGGARRSLLSARTSVQRLHHGRRHLFGEHQQRSQEGVRHSDRDAFGGRPGPSGTRAVGRHGRRRYVSGVRRSHRRNSGVRHRHRIAGHPAQGVGARRRDGPVDFGHSVPAVVQEDRARINAASGNRPLVVLANLSGFDGSPESLRNIQLENGAEIGRAIVNFDGPIVFCVVSRYHGGAFVVFSNALNENMEVLAVEGSFSSVIGGAPAAAVVFTREVNRRTAADPAVRELEAQLAAATDDAASASLRVKLGATPDGRAFGQTWRGGSESLKLFITWSGPARWARSTRSFRRLNCARASSRPWSVGWPEQRRRSVTESMGVQDRRLCAFAALGVSAAAPDTKVSAAPAMWSTTAAAALSPSPDSMASTMS